MFLTQNNNYYYYKIRGFEETFGYERCVYGIDCSDGFMEIYLTPNSPNSIH